jgi:hypothetical protein
MARRFSNKMAAKQVTSITKPGKHSDGNGLYLLVKPNGNRSWVLIPIGGGQRREMGLGGTVRLTRNWFVSAFCHRES